MKIITPSVEATGPQSVNSVHGVDFLLDSLLTSGFHWMVSENNFSCFCSVRKLHPILADNDLDAISYLMGLLCETAATNTPGDDALSMCRAPVGAKHAFFWQLGDTT